VPALAPPGSGRRQVLLVLAALALCPVAAWLIGDHPPGAIARGAALADAERWLGVHVEPAVAGWGHRHGTFMALVTVFYLGAHVPVAGWALIWTWYLRRDRFRQVRDTFLWLQGLLVACWVALPTAPPPLVPGSGVPDELADTGGGGPAAVAHVLQSPFAAMPSGHVAFALVAGAVFVRLGDQAWLRWFGWAYPGLVVAVTVVTGNHLLLDAGGAALVTLVAVQLASPRPARARQIVRRRRLAVVVGDGAPAQRVDANPAARLRSHGRAARHAARRLALRPDRPDVG
jgi:PAP2 superfamily